MYTHKYVTKIFFIYPFAFYNVFLHIYTYIHNKYIQYNTT